MTDLKGLVKPLLWEHHPCGWVAAPPTGRSYIIDTRRKGKFEVIKGLTFSTPFPTREAAKAAAQADYEARIVAALDLAKVEALVEAVRHEREMVCQDMGMQLKASEAVDAALAAMKGGDT
jgi:hypothetical protein